MKIPSELIIAFVLIVSSSVFGFKKDNVVDSLPIKNHYIQNGKVLKRRNMEKMLLKIDTSRSYISRSRNCRAAGNVIGFSIFAISMGITVAKVSNTIEALQNKKPLSSNLDNLFFPLMIGCEIGSFFQSRLLPKSNYLLHKGITAFNYKLCQKQKLDSLYNHHISKSQNKKNWYRQDGVDFSTETLYYILIEKPSAKSLAIQSLFYREAAYRTMGFGATFLMLAIIGLIEGEKNNAYLAAGISITGFGIVSEIASRVSLKHAIRKYNKSVPASLPCKTASYIK